MTDLFSPIRPSSPVAAVLTTSPTSTDLVSLDEQQSASISAGVSSEEKVLEGPFKGMFRYGTRVSCDICSHSTLWNLQDEKDCKVAEAHVKTHWLRKYLGRMHDDAARNDEINWDALAKFMPFPQSGDEMPIFIVALLKRTMTMGYGSYEIQYVLDAIFRNIIEYSMDRESDEHGVRSKAILDAVYNSRILSAPLFARFKMLFENHLPIIAVSFSERNGVMIPSFRRPWHGIKQDFLDQSNWALQWTAPSKQSKGNTNDDDDDNGHDGDDEAEDSKGESKKKRKVAQDN